MTPARLWALYATAIFISLPYLLVADVSRARFARRNLFKYDKLHVVTVIGV